MTKQHTRTLELGKVSLIEEALCNIKELTNDQKTFECRLDRRKHVAFLLQIIGEAIKYLPKKHSQKFGSEAMAMRNHVSHSLSAAYLEEGAQGYYRMVTEGVLPDFQAIISEIQGKTKNLPNMSTSRIQFREENTLSEDDLAFLMSSILNNIYEKMTELSKIDSLGDAQEIISVVVIDILRLMRMEECGPTFLLHENSKLRELFDALRILRNNVLAHVVQEDATALDQVFAVAKAALDLDENGSFIAELVSEFDAMYQSNFVTKGRVDLDETQVKVSLSESETANINRRMQWIQADQLPLFYCINIMRRYGVESALYTLVCLHISNTILEELLCSEEVRSMLKMSRPRSMHPLLYKMLHPKLTSVVNVKFNTTQELLNYADNLACLIDFFEYPVNKINPKNGLSAMGTLVYDAHPAIFWRLLDYPTFRSHINSVCMQGNVFGSYQYVSLVHLAVMIQDETVLTILLQAGADVNNTCNDHAMTPLQVASAYYGYESVVENTFISVNDEHLVFLDVAVPEATNQNVCELLLARPDILVNAVSAISERTPFTILCARYVDKGQNIDYRAIAKQICTFAAHPDCDIDTMIEKYDYAVGHVLIAQEQDPNLLKELMHSIRSRGSSVLRGLLHSKTGHPDGYNWADSLRDLCTGRRDKEARTCLKILQRAEQCLDMMERCEHKIAEFNAKITRLTSMLENSDMAAFHARIREELPIKQACLEEWNEAYRLLHDSEVAVASVSLPASMHETGITKTASKSNVSKRN